jgi:hypothetical protein
MLKVVVYYYDKEREGELTEEDRAKLSTIELACTKSLNNWRMPFKLR